MIDLIQSKKITDDLILEFNLNTNDKLYECYSDNTKIGYAVIRDDEKDMVYLIIAQKYQNLGYGSIIFKQLISMINGNIKCQVPLDNYKMQRIIMNNKGIEIGRDGKLINYIIEKH